MKFPIMFIYLGVGLIRAEKDLSSSVDIQPNEVVNNKLIDDNFNQEAPVLQFAVKEGNDTCILAQFSGTITTQQENVTSTIIVNGTLGDESQCGDVDQTLDVKGFDGSLLKFVFGRSNSSIVLSMVQITLSINNTYESNPTKTLYTVPVGNSFKCDSGISVDLSDEKNETITLSLKSMRFDAFRTGHGEDYETNSICSADAKSNKTVPMIIAFVLGGMVVIMLVGYIILRRREDKSVYQSV